jgi:hypothetical protein
VGHGEYEPDIATIEAQSVEEPCKPDGINIVSCKHPERQKFIDEVDGLNFKSVTIKNPLLGRLPLVIPIIEKSLLRINPELIPCEVVGLTLGDVFMSKAKQFAGMIQTPKHFRFDSRLLGNPIFKEKQVILFGSGPDSLIEPLWYLRDDLDLFKNISEFGFAGMSGINFSVFAGECAFAQGLNQKKSLKSLELMQDSGISVIPHVYAVTDDHRKRWVEWLNFNPRVEIITINCQLQNERREDVETIKATVRYILEHTLVKPHIILQGLSLKYLDEMCDCVEYLHVALSTASYDARLNTEKVYDNERHSLVKLPYKPKPKEEIFINNLLAYNSYSQKICAV